MFCGCVNPTAKPIRGVWGGDCSSKIRFFSFVTGLLAHSKRGKPGFLLVRPAPSAAAGPAAGLIHFHFTQTFHGIPADGAHRSSFQFQLPQRRGAGGPERPRRWVRVRLPGFAQPLLGSGAAAPDRARCTRAGIHGGPSRGAGFRGARRTPRCAPIRWCRPRQTAFPASSLKHFPVGRESGLHSLRGQRPGPKSQRPPSPRLAGYQGHCRLR